MIDEKLRTEKCEDEGGAENRDEGRKAGRPTTSSPALLHRPLSTDQYAQQWASVSAYMRVLPSHSDTGIKKRMHAHVHVCERVAPVPL